ncbi:MAG TPA: MgtC/SapB family protein [Verrucomicrobiae bacterium]|nr:MgtC/SapB family protein [Verrucomicrobiae bacterium]
MSLEEFTYYDIFLKLLLAGVLGGLIGIEREALRKSAGFRTHVLVCLGSALIMIISQDIFRMYHNVANADPARLAAQVVSGIGFLGAGTIMREGVNVRGLTTAASLWVVSGIGLAVGAGMYWAAGSATALVFLALVFLGKLEKYILGTSHLIELVVKLDERPGMIGSVGAALGDLKVNIKHIEIKERPRDAQILLELSCELPRGLEPGEMVKNLAQVDGVHMVTIED